MIEEEIVLLTYNICTVITNLAQLRNLLSASILWGLLIEVKGVEDRNRKSKSKTIPNSLCSLLNIFDIRPCQNSTHK